MSSLGNFALTDSWWNSARLPSIRSQRRAAGRLTRSKDLRLCRHYPLIIKDVV